MIFLLLLLSSAILLCYLYIFGKVNENYWKKRGVTFHNKNKIMGVFWDFLTKEQALFMNLRKIYKKYPNELAVRMGALFSPSLFVLNPTNIQHVLSVNFNAFNNRFFAISDSDVLGNNLLFQNGKKWKLVRQNMTPLFTSAKLKSMYYVMERSAQDFVKYLDDNPELKNGDLFQVLSTFCSAAVSAAMFGISTESVFDSPFLKMATLAFKSSFIGNLVLVIGILCAPLYKFLQIELFKEHETFFVGAIKQILRRREQEKTKKHDFADLGVLLQATGVLKDETGMEIQPSDELLAAQAFFFFNAGVEPSATVIFSVLMELGKNPEILQRVHKEIDEVFEKCDGNITYDTYFIHTVMFSVLMEIGRHPKVLQRIHTEIDEAFEKGEGKISYEILTDMKYLDMVMNESMRLHPAIGFLNRQCTQDTQLPVGNIKVDKGTKIFVPIFDVHHDEKYYPNPEKFIPERFSPENKSNIQDALFMPFGNGQRTCIGMRYAHYLIKAGLIHLLRHFTVETKVPATGIQYKKDIVAVRIKNIDVKLLDRKLKKVN